MAYHEQFVYTVRWTEFNDEYTVDFSQSSHGVEYEKAMYAGVRDLTARGVAAGIERRRIVDTEDEFGDIVQMMRTATAVAEFAVNCGIGEKKIQMIKTMRTAHPKLGLRDAKQMIEVALENLPL